MHVLEGCTFMDVGSSEAGKFQASDTKLGTSGQFDKALKMPCEISCWGARCTCSARASLLYPLLVADACRSNG